MEENHVAFEASPSDDHETTTVAHGNGSGGDHGWQKVTYAKRQRKTKASPAPSDSAANHPRLVSNGAVSGGDNVFRSLEQQAEDRRRRILEAQRAANGVAAVAAPARSKVRSDYDDDEDSDSDAAVENGKPEDVKKVKQKKPKKPKVTVAEAAAKIDANDLAAFLVEISVCWPPQFRF